MMRKSLVAPARSLRPSIFAPTQTHRIRTLTSLVVPSSSRHQPSVSSHRPTVSVNGTVTRGTASSSPIAFTTLVELQARSCQHFGPKNCLGMRSAKGDKYDWISYTEFGQRVERMRIVLKHHGVGKGDKVALISNNRVEWAVIFYATASVGGALVPMYEAQMEKDWKYIISDSDSKLVVAANEAIYHRINQYVGTVGKVSGALCLDALSPNLAYSYDYWMDKVAKEPAVPAAPVVASDIATIIYTSGTTGNPKGVELSHENLCANVDGNLVRMKEMFRPEMVGLGFLPWAHIFGQTCDLHCLFATGISMGIVEKREHILEGLQLVKPNIMASVPMLFNRVYDGVMKKINEGSPLSRRLAMAALAVARQRNHLLEYGRPVPFLLNLQYALASRVVLSKIRGRISPQLQYMNSGGAATSLPVLQFFEDIGVPITEGYGLTETSPVISVGSHQWTTRRLGCVGTPLHNVTVNILDPDTKQERPADTDGEICVAGPSVMTGYRNNPQANDEVFFQKDGKKFFRTGDLGRMVEGKFLKVTGRIKEQYKLENGKYVVPAPLEDAMTRSLYIAQAFLFGDNKKHNVTIVVPDLNEIKTWAVNQPAIDKFTMDHPEKLINHPDTQKLLTVELAAVCAPMKNFERPSRWAAITEPFSQENQMLTPKMSLRRNNVISVYAAVMQALYAGPGTSCGTVEISSLGAPKTVPYVICDLPWDKSQAHPEDRGAERVQESIVESGVKRK